MVEKLVRSALKDFDMLKKSREITVALSGGADSVSLLHILKSLEKELGLKITAAHLNHLIRGAEADRDEAFVKKLCDRLSVELVSERTNVPAFAESEGLSLELAARSLRYDFLNRVSKGVIATAHNADDNLETILFNLTRGTALKGLCGIPPVRDNIIRPIIYCSRAQIEEYCKGNDLSFVTDSTNLSDDYTRNKIRHNVIPVLKEINPSVTATALRMSEALTEDNAFIGKAANEEFISRFNNEDLDLKGFEAIDKAVAIRVLKAFLNQFDIGDISAKHYSQLYNICISGGEISLPKITLISEFSVLRVKQESISDFKVEFLNATSEEFINSKKINNLLLKNYIDCDKIVGKLVLRTRNSGDTIRLKNKNGTKPLTKLYNEYKIPLEMRDNLPVVSDDEGIVWIYKIGVAERVAADEQSENIIKINVI